MPNDDRAGERIARLAAQLHVEVPPPPAVAPRTARRRTARWIVAGASVAAAVAVAAVVLVDRDGERRVIDAPPVDSETVATETVATETMPTEPATTVEATTTAPTATAVTTTTDAPAADSLTMPIIDLPGCSLTFARDSAGGVEIRNPFARSSTQPVAFQVVGDPGGSMTQPFAIVQRFFADQRVVTGTTAGVDINGHDGRLSWNETKGRGILQWIADDGSEAYVRSDSLSQDELITLARGLVARPADAAVPGFDLDPATMAGWMILGEWYGPVVSGPGAWSECRFADGRWLWVRVLGPGVIYRAVALLDHSPSITIAQRDLPDGSLLTVSARPDATELVEGALDVVRNTTPEQWRAMTLYPRPEEMNVNELPVDQPLIDDVGGTFVSTFDEVAAAVVEHLRRRLSADEQSETTFTINGSFDLGSMIVSQSTQDDSVVARRWLLWISTDPDDIAKGFHLDQAYEAIVCRDGSVHPPDFGGCP